MLASRFESIWESEAFHQQSCSSCLVDSMKLMSAQTMSIMVVSVMKLVPRYNTTHYSQNSIVLFFTQNTDCEPMGSSSSPSLTKHATTSNPTITTTKSKGALDTEHFAQGFNDTPHLNVSQIHYLYCTLSLVFVPLLMITHDSRKC